MQQTADIEAYTFAWIFIVICVKAKRAAKNKLKHDLVLCATI